MMIYKNLKGLERMEVLITSCVKALLGNKYNSYIHAARNAKVTSTRDVYEKTVLKRKNKSFQRRIYNPLEHLRFFEKKVNGVTKIRS